MSLTSESMTRVAATQETGFAAHPVFMEKGEPAGIDNSGRILHHPAGARIRSFPCGQHERNGF